MLRPLHRYLVLALLAAALPSCAPAPESATVPPDFSLRLKRGGCEGSCPIYSISVDSGGSARWHGERFVRVKEPATKRVSDAALQAIAKRARELRMLALRPGKYPCIDSSLTEIELTMDGGSIDVAYCIGDARPEGRRVIEFARFVDEALADGNWVGGDEFRRMQ